MAKYLQTIINVTRKITFLKTLVCLDSTQYSPAFFIQHPDPSYSTIAGRGTFPGGPLRLSATCCFTVQTSNLLVSCPRWDTPR